MEMPDEALQPDGTKLVLLPLPRRSFWSSSGNQEKTGWL